MINYLDKTGLIYLWNKIKEYINNHPTQKSDMSLTPNGSYISNFTNNSCIVGNIGIVNCYFKNTAQIPSGTTIVTLPFSTNKRFEGMVNTNTDFEIGVYTSGNKIVANAALPVSSEGKFRFLHITVCK